MLLAGPEPDAITVVAERQLGDHQPEPRRQLVRGVVGRAPDCRRPPGNEAQPAVIAGALGKPADDAGDLLHPRPDAEHPIGTSAVQLPRLEIPEIQHQRAAVPVRKRVPGPHQRAVGHEGEASRLLAIDGHRQPPVAQPADRQGAVAIRGEPANVGGTGSHGDRCSCRRGAAGRRPDPGGGGPAGEIGLTPNGRRKYIAGLSLWPNCPSRRSPCSSSAGRPIGPSPKRLRSSLIPSCAGCRCAGSPTARSSCGSTRTFADATSTSSIRPIRRRRTCSSCCC